MNKLPPQLIRDFHGGRNTPYSISDYIVPSYTVSDSINVLFDQVIGSIVVRKGTTIVGATVATNKNPLGLANYVSTKGTAYNRLIATFSGASTASVYYQTGTTWNTSNLTTLTNTARVRHEMLGNQMFLANGVVFKSSSDGGATWGTTNCTTIAVGVILRAKARLLATADTRSTSSPSRVFFSSVVDPTPAGAGTITWNTHPTTGDWIDVNPDDGDSNTAMIGTSTYTLVFKNHAMYRLDVINKSVDPDKIIDVGTPSQEAVTSCQGIVYFFSGMDIRRTTGDFPEQISRLGVQDYIDAIPQANWTAVEASSDGLNVYFAIGNVTLNTAQDSQVTRNNVVLKFSPRDQSWSVHSYAQKFIAFTNINTITIVGTSLIGADTSGNVQSLNNGSTDNTAPIFFEATTQDLEFGNLADKKTISNQLVFFTKFGKDSSVVMYPDDKDEVVIPSAKNLNNRVNISKNVNVSFNSLKFKWFGNTSGTSPQFDGIYIQDITSDGLIK